MGNYSEMNEVQLKDLLVNLQKKYDDYKGMKLNLDMSRGKPCKEQLDLSNELLTNNEILKSYMSKEGTDCRNYGVLDGLPEMKDIFAQLFNIDMTEIIVGGNSSLNFMYDSMCRAMLLGVDETSAPWSKCNKVKFLCPVPGYDRHFAVLESLGIEMIPVPMLSDRPDMDYVEEVAASDDCVKGIWCVPQYSNPDGAVYSDSVVKRFATMKTKANDFRIFWDNAYCVHHLFPDDITQVADILAECKKAGNPDRVYMFASTSKITYPGAGIAAIMASKKNIDYIKKVISKQTIGFDKINQIRHAKFLKSKDNVINLMKKHADIIRPKFEAVIEILDKNLAGKGIANWSEPKGGYFISFNAVEGCAKKIGKLAFDAGLVVTPAGATYPLGNDPKNSNIRIAPTLPPINELKTAMELFCVCVEIAAIEKFLEV